MGKKVIAFTGRLASGKSPALEGLQRRGALIISLSDFVRALQGQEDDQTTRTEEQGFSDELAAQFGEDFLARLAAAVMDNNEQAFFVVDGVRRPGEFAFLSRECNAERVAIMISDEDQRRNVEQRQRPSDLHDPHGINAFAERDRGTHEPPYGQQVDECIKMVPESQRIINPGNEQQFGANIVEGLNPILKRMGIEELNLATIAGSLEGEEH